MPEAVKARYPRWFVWLAMPFELVGAYLIVFTPYDAIGIALFVAWMVLTWHFAIARKPHGD